MTAVLISALVFALSATAARHFNSHGEGVQNLPHFLFCFLLAMVSLLCAIFFCGVYVGSR